VAAACAAAWRALSGTAGDFPSRPVGAGDTLAGTGEGAADDAVVAPAEAADEPAFTPVEAAVIAMPTGSAEASEANTTPTAANALKRNRPAVPGPTVLVRITAGS